MKTLIFANNGQSVRRHTREFISKLDNRFDVIYFVSHSDKRFFKDNKKVIHLNFKSKTSDEKYINTIKTQPDILKSQKLCFADDSVVYLFNVNNLFTQMEGKSDFWSILLTNYPGTHPDSSFVYFDRDTAGPAIEKFNSVNLESAGTLRKQIYEIYLKLMRSGYSFNYITDSLVHSNHPLSIIQWDKFAACSWPLVNTNLYSKNWRLNNFGLQLSSIFTESSLFEILGKNSSVVPDFKTFLSDIE